MAWDELVDVKVRMPTTALFRLDRLAHFLGHETYGPVIAAALCNYEADIMDVDNDNDLPATLPPVALSTEDAGMGEPAGL
jgi:hypothetical protein